MKGFGIFSASVGATVLGLGIFAQAEEQKQHEVNEIKQDISIQSINNQEDAALWIVSGSKNMSLFLPALKKLCEGAKAGAIHVTPEQYPFAEVTEDTLIGYISIISLTDPDVVKGWLKVAESEKNVDMYNVIALGSSFAENSEVQLKEGGKINFGKKQDLIKNLPATGAEASEEDIKFLLNTAKGAYCASGYPYFLTSAFALLEVVARSADDDQKKETVMNQMSQELSFFGGKETVVKNLEKGCPPGKFNSYFPVLSNVLSSS